jgi:hypothetical protein
MTARSRMTHRAVLERNVATGTDPFGAPLPPSWSSLGLVSCWAWESLSREVVGGQGEYLLSDARVLFPRGADVRRGDRVLNITDRLGAVYLAGPFEVEAITPKPDHQEAALRRVS